MNWYYYVPFFDHMRQKNPQNRRLSLEKPLEIANYVFCPLPENEPKISEKIRENIKVRPFLNRSFYPYIAQAQIALW